MKVLHIISGISRKAGGPSRSSQGLVAALCKVGVDAWIWPLDGAEPWIDGVRKAKMGLKRRSVSSEALEEFDLVHIHGLWDPKLHALAKMCQRSGKPYIISPRGMLDPWALSVKRWKKWLAMFLYQRRDLKRASAIHVTAALEERNVRAQGFEQPIIISPNGVDIPEDMPPRANDGSIRTAIFLSRLHPGKGLLILAEAWAIVRPKGWVMKIVGPDSYGHKVQVVERLEQLGIRDQWQFVDMLNDNEKWTAYRGADLLIHPSVSENFGITIAEGLAAELPVICTNGTPWAEIADRKCGWYIKANSVPALVDALFEATTSTNLREMGRRGHKLVEERYTWAAVCKKMLSGYEMVLKKK